MLIHTSLALQGSDSRDWSKPPRKNRGDPYGCRQAIRFPINLPVRYQAGGQSGRGELVNISKRGALFTIDRALASGTYVEVYIMWPALFNNSIQLSLIVAGTIKRVEPGRAALAIDKYEFRTCASSLFQRTQPRRAGRVAPAQQSPSESHMAQVLHPGTPDAAGRLECLQLKLTGECPLTQRPRGKQAGIGPGVSKNRQQRKVEVSDALWERIFQEKFVDPEYYSSRWLPHSSPTVSL